ncbi:hypothetical protein COO60DRAFT_1183740 [Scenedesmus sp. NREL 46B-D3]|nr:hypothetical protein COO60DRAFT_1183740 [Scenedesmus sp. NREL 46B-D3]
MHSMLPHSLLLRALRHGVVSRLIFSLECEAQVLQLACLADVQEVAAAVGVGVGVERQPPHTLPVLHKSTTRDGKRQQQRHCQRQLL